MISTEERQAKKNALVHQLNENVDNILQFDNALLEFIVFELEDDRRFFFHLSDIYEYSFYFKLDWTIDDFKKKRSYEQRDIEIELLKSIS
ncbi:MAG TPA: hypothetical protein ENJ95_02940 [Bacteroidetes bacterium]|nr:hypothetical protein [Bacteroidota bacterium]